MAPVARLLLLAIITLQAAQTDSQTSSVAPGPVGSTIPGTTTAPMQPLPAGYSYTWTLVSNAHDPTAITLDPHTTLAGCKWACLGLPSCTGFDYIPGLPSIPSLCYLSYSSSLAPYPGCFHWELQRNPPTIIPGGGPACQYTYNWTITANSHVFGGTAYSGINVGDYASCQAACIQNINCTGIDFNAVVPSPNNCWIITTPGAALQNINGLTHYDIMRICTMPPPTTAMSGECTPVYTMFGNSSAGNGIQQPPGTTEQACRSACTTNPGCYAVDMNTMTSLCYLLMSSASEKQSNYGTSIGINHYAISRNTNCAGCTNVWTLTTNTTVSISNMTSVSSTSESDCLNQCMQQMTCVGVVYYNGACSLCMALATANSTQTLTDSDYWIFTRDPNCGACTDQWNKVMNMALSWGSAIQWAVTNADCRMACSMDNTCMAYSFYPSSTGNNPVNYCLTSSSTTSPPMSAVGAISYMRIISMCNGGCMNTWSLSVNMYATASRSLYPSSLSEVGCKNYCIQNPACTGVDNMGSQCWIVTKSPPQLQQLYSSNHWDLQRGQNCDACSATWSVSMGDSEANGSPTAFTTDAQCRSSCLASPSCSSYLFSVVGRVVGAQTIYCWVNLTGAAVIDPMMNRTDLIRSPCGTSGVCPVQWMLTANSSSTAVSMSATAIQARLNVSESMCQSTCAGNIACVGIDYYNNVVGTAIYPCYILTTASYPLVSMNGSNHWDLVREFPSSCNPGCLLSWTLMANTHLNMAASYNAAATEEDCKTACATIATCTSIDFNPMASRGYQCWLGSGQGLLPGPGINHFVLNSSCYLSPLGSTVTTTTTTASTTNATSSTIQQVRTIPVSVSVVLCMALQAVVATATN